MHDDPLSAPREDPEPPLPRSYYDAFDVLAAQPHATVAVVRPRRPAATPPSTTTLRRA